MLLEFHPISRENCITVEAGVMNRNMKTEENMLSFAFHQADGMKSMHETIIPNAVCTVQIEYNIL
jgi:hypothetical protein